MTKNKETSSKGYRVSTTGELELLDIKKDGNTHGDALRQTIDCRYFDVIGLRHNIDCWVDDEGNFVENPEYRNFVATLMLTFLGWSPTHIIKGNVVFLNGNKETGETTSLSVEQQKLVILAWQFGKGQARHLKDGF